VENVGSRTVVYVAVPQQQGKFIEGDVRLGDRSGKDVVVLSGAQPGENVVADGSFAVRAERDRLGLRATVAPAPANAQATSSQGAARPEPQGGKVLVPENGYEPAMPTLRAGAPARTTFVRTTDNTCGIEVVFPSLNIRRPLPLNEPVVIEFTPQESRAILFMCGMNMLRGTLAVQ
jgi:hypothetical protein